MSDLRELYQDTIIDHGRHPRNLGKLAQATHQKEGFNPLCGDKITVYVNEQENIIQEMRFEGCGCAISMASASLMTEVLRGKTRAALEEIFTAFHLLVTQGDASAETLKKLGKLAVLGGVCDYPARVKCATLAWHTLKAALIRDDAAVTTENEA